MAPAKAGGALSRKLELQDSGFHVIYIYTVCMCVYMYIYIVLLIYIYMAKDKDRQCSEPERPLVSALGLPRRA